MDDLIDIPQRDNEPAVVPQVYGWSGNGIVLLGEQCGDRWVVARGWLADDTLTNVRRWSFATPGPFAGQIRRLVWDATADAALARQEGSSALAWAQSLS